MLRNYLAAAIRNLFRDRAYAAINICGLALGFAAAILIGLFVRDELSYDRAYPDSERTFLLYQYIKGAQPLTLSVSPPDFARALELDFPEVESATRIFSGGGTLRQQNVEVATGIRRADPDFFRMFPPKAVAGDVNAALESPDALVVTRKFARQLFGRENIVGELVQLNRQETRRIAAVIENLPSSTHFSFDVIASTKADKGLPEQNARTYVRLRPGADVRQLNALMQSFVKRHVTTTIGTEPAWKLLEVKLVALPDLHFLPAAIGDMKAPSDRRTVNALTVIGLLILFLAGSNFVSMMTARAARRAIEVGVRKAVGATRPQIIVQFMGECLFYAGFALALAMIAVELALPAFNGFLQRDIAFDYVRDPALGAAIVAVWGVVSLAAGAYPALVLSMFRPVTVLKGAISLPGGPGRMRNALVVLQFGTLVALIVSTLTISRQTRFAIEDQLRVPGDELYLMQFACVVGFRDVALRIPGVRGATCASGNALGTDVGGAHFALPTGGTIRLGPGQIDASFFDTFGVEPLAGRLFDDRHGQDNILRVPAATANPSLILNESAARALGYADPRDAVGKTRYWSRVAQRDGKYLAMDLQGSEVVGVVPDFALGSIRSAIEPTAYFIDPTWTPALVLKLDGKAIPQTMRALEAAWKQKTDGRPFNGQFMSQILNDLYSDILRQTRLFAAFSAVAIVIASLGLLGLAVFTAQRRTREIGLRKVMGASQSDILRFIGWQFARPIVLANLVAWPCAWFLMRRWLEGFAYHVSLGVTSFVAASALAAVIALITVTGHALLVSRARPVEALRYE
ncbi:MAG: ABC transporter permease [Gammaproteobacteria bacterium]